MSKSTNKHVGVNTGTIINTRRGDPKDAYKMERYRFCNMCNNYCNGKCNAGDVKGFEVQDIAIANKCKYYSENIELNNYKKKNNYQGKRNNKKKYNSTKKSQKDICKFVTIRYEVIEKINGKYKNIGNKHINGLQIKNKVFFTDGHYRIIDNKYIKVIKTWKGIPEWATDDLISKYNSNK